MEVDAFRIWQYCRPRGWDRTSRHIADALNIPHRRVIIIIARKGWSSRIRSLAVSDSDPRADYRAVIDNQLDGIAFRHTMTAIIGPDASAG